MKCSVKYGHFSTHTRTHAHTNCQTQHYFEKFYLLVHMRTGSEIKYEERTLLTNVGVLARLVVFWITGVPVTNTSVLLCLIW